MTWGGANQSGDVFMHPVWLYLRPSGWEQLYYGQFEALDMLNCVICPIFFANMLARWPRSFVTVVYSVVLALKGYQLTLLLLPAARTQHAHLRARYWIILTERILRQWVATPALGRGHNFVGWLRDTAAANSGAATAVKLAMMTSGIMHATWNAFCLPLDFVTQAVINLVFFCINTTTALCQVAYTVALLVRAKPQVVWLQWGIERVTSTTLWPAQYMLGGVVRAIGRRVASLSDFEGMPGSLSADGMSWQGSVQAQSQLVLRPPGLAPDLETLAGRLVLSTSMALILFFVLYLPLLLAWRLELHFKAQFMAAVMRRGGGDASGQQARDVDEGSEPGDTEDTSGGSSASDTTSSSSSRSITAGNQLMVGCSAGRLPTQPCSTHSAGTVSAKLAPFNTGSFKCSTISCSTAAPVALPGDVPAFARGTPKSWAPQSWVQHVCMAACVCCVLGEGFTWLCCVSPAVKGMLWPQVPLAP